MEGVKQDEIFSLIKSVSGQHNVLTIPRLFLDRLDSDFPTALMLSQLVYWSDKGKQEDGYIYKSDADWEKEIGVSRRQSRRARKRLCELGLIETKIKKANGAPTVHYRLKKDELVKWIVPKGPFDSTETGQSLTEITPETTTQTASDSRETSQEKTARLLENEEVDNWIAQKDEEKPAQLKRESGGTRRALERFEQREVGNVEIENYIVMLPERVRPIAREFCEHFGRPPIKKENSYWIVEWESQADLGLLPKHIKAAIADMTNEGLHIKSPASVTSIAERFKREGTANAPGTGVTQVWKGGERIR
jgi:hypothetical protein